MNEGGGERDGLISSALWRQVETWAPVGGLFLLSSSAAAYEIAPASVTPTIMADLGVGEASAGWIVSIMYLVAVLASVPVGVALDRTDVRRAVTAAGLALLLAGGAGWVVAADGRFLVLLATRVVGGLAYVTIWNAGADLAGRLGPPESRATAVGVFTASAPAGFALGQFGAPLVAAAGGWPAIFPTFGGLAVFGLMLYRWGAGQAGAGDTTTRETPGREAVGRVFRSRAVWTVCGMGLAGFALYLFLNQWLPTYLVRRLSVTEATAGLLTALFPAVGIVARTGGGALSDRVFAGRRRPVALLSFGVAAPVVVGLLFVGSVAGAVALVVAAGAAIQLGIGLLFSYVREVVPEEVAATAVSLLTAVGLVGAFLAPVVAGQLVQATGEFTAAFLGAGLVAAAGVLLALLTPEPAENRSGP
jgi:nitrate/nitrite transporter NarK